jgi:hypothetical protein
MKSFLKFIWKNFVPSFIKENLWDVRGLRFSYKSFGTKNPDKKFLLMGKHLNTNGLFSIVCVALMNIRYCLQHNIILVVDLQNNDNQYLDGLGVGKENSWEYFFEQPFGYNLEQIRNSKNIIISNRLTPFSCISKYKYFYKFFLDDLSPRNNNTLFRDLKNDFKKHIRFNETVMDYINSEYERIFNGQSRVLGVLARGTDYLLTKPKGHKVQPEPNLILEKSKQVMQDYKCEFVYLATEDKNIYTLFRETFNEKLLVNSQKMISLSGSELKKIRRLSEFNSGRERDKYNIGLEYLSSLYNLSKCQCFVGGLTNGTLGVLFMRDNDFEYEYLFDLGYYK